MAEDFFSLPLSQVSCCITWKGNVRVRLGHSQPYATLMAHRNKVFKKRFSRIISVQHRRQLAFFSTVVQSCTFKTVNSQCMSIFFSLGCRSFFKYCGSYLFTNLYQSKLNNPTVMSPSVKCLQCDRSWYKNDKSGIQPSNKLAQDHLSIFHRESGYSPQIKSDLGKTAKSRVNKNTLHRQRKHLNDICSIIIFRQILSVLGSAGKG